MNSKLNMPLGHYSIFTAQKLTESRRYRI